MSSQFKGAFSVQKGGVHLTDSLEFTILAREVPPCATDAELVEFYFDAAKKRFLETVGPSATGVAQFIAWAKEIQNGLSI